MATIPQIRTAIEARLGTLAALRVQQEWGSDPPVSATASVAVVKYAGTVYDTDFQGGATVNFTIDLVAGGDERSARTRLDAFCDHTPGSTTSVRAAVSGTLGGVVPDAHVVSNTEYQDYPIGPEGSAYLGTQFSVAVMQ